MKNVNAYVALKNPWRKLFNRPPYDLNDPKDVQELYDDIQTGLSPENLTCDGELRGTALKQKATMLNGALNEIRAYAEGKGIALKEFNYDLF
jgi:hypothetical protein